MGIEPFQTFGGDLKDWTIAELKEFGFAFPDHGTFVSRNPDSRVALSLPPPNDVRIESFEDIEFHVIAKGHRGHVQRRLDSSYLISRLHELGFSNIHIVVVNVGGHIDKATLKMLADKLRATLRILDGQQQFCENIQKAIRAHAMPHDLYPVSSTISRPSLPV